MPPLRTVRNYDFFEVTSAMQKAIRRGDSRLAGYFGIELFESGFREYLWKRLLVISAEDVWGIITYEVEALYRSWQAANKKKKGSGRVFASKAIILLALARKSRDADHLTNCVYDEKLVDSKILESYIEEARADLETIPDYAYDQHTRKGKKLGMTKRDFIKREFEALTPREPGLFDDLI